MPKKVAMIKRGVTGGAGHIGTVVERLGYEWEVVDRDALATASIDVSDYAMLCLFGSWKNIDPGEPTIRAEIELVTQAIAKHIPVVGICFGGQLLAHVAGGKVFHLKRPRLGFYPVALRGSPNGTVEQFFWNDDGYTVPEGAEVLASTDESCLAYQTKDTLALQFHCDVTPVQLASWTQDPTGAAKLKKKGVSREQLLAQAKAYEAAVVRDTLWLFKSFLDQHAKQR